MDFFCLSWLHVLLFVVCVLDLGRCGIFFVFLLFVCFGFIWVVFLTFLCIFAFKADVTTHSTAGDALFDLHRCSLSQNMGEIKRTDQWLNERKARQKRLGHRWKLNRNHWHEARSWAAAEGMWSWGPPLRHKRGENTSGAPHRQGCGGATERRTWAETCRLTLLRTLAGWRRGSLQAGSEGRIGMEGDSGEMPGPAGPRRAPLGPAGTGAERPRRSERWRENHTPPFPS